MMHNLDDIFVLQIRSVLVNIPIHFLFLLLINNHLQLQVNNQYLILGTQRIALSNVKKVALDSKVKLGKKYYAYFSLPFNPIEGKTISIYFDQSSYVAFKQYISTSIDDVEFIR
jgi:hypothetical protein